MWSLSFTQMEEGDAEGRGRSLLEARAIADGWAVRAWRRWRCRAGPRRRHRGDVERGAPAARRGRRAGHAARRRPVHAGYVYCAVISICRALCDWGRATEWTKVSTRYCERESIAGYTGLCRFHQGEIDRLHGHLAEAEERVLQACEELLGVNRYSAGWGYSELVEIRVRRGDLAGAEEALAQAVAFGDDGQPGRGRLLLAQGDARAAVRSLTRCAGRPRLPRPGAPGLPPPRARRACLAVGDEQAAAESVAELEELARRFGTPDRRRGGRRRGSWRSTGATPRRRSRRCRTGSAPGARSTPRTKPRRRACCSPEP
jgi:hypothetical protein